MISRLISKYIFIFLIIGFNSSAETFNEVENSDIDNFASQIKLGKKTKEEFFQNFKISYYAYIQSRRVSNFSGDEILSLTNVVNNFPTNKNLTLDLNSNFCPTFLAEKVDRDVSETRREQIERQKQREKSVMDCKAHVDSNLKPVAKEYYRTAKNLHEEELKKLNEISDLYKSLYKQEGSQVNFLSDIEFIDINSVKTNKRVNCKLPFFKSNNIEDFVNKFPNGSDINIQNLNDEVFKEVIKTNVDSKEACARDREYNLILNHVLELSKKESRLLSIIGKDYVCFVKDQNKLTIEELDRISILIKDNSSENPELADSITSYFSLIKSRIENNEDITATINDNPEYNAWNEFYKSYSDQCDQKSERASDYIPWIMNTNKSNYEKNCVNDESNLNVSECRISAVNKAIEVVKDYVLQNQVENSTKNEVHKRKNGIDCTEDIRSNYCANAYDKNWKHEINNWGVNKCLK